MVDVQGLAGRSKPLCPGQELRQMVNLEAKQLAFTLKRPSSHQDRFSSRRNKKLSKIPPKISFLIVPERLGSGDLSNERREGTYPSSD